MHSGQGDQVVHASPARCLSYLAGGPVNLRNAVVSVIQQKRDV